MAALPYIQIYVADYLSDTMHLDAEEHGAYLLLIFNYWQTGKPLPKKRLAKIARVSNDRWPAVEDSLSEFFNDTGTVWEHKRIEADLRMVEEAQAQRAKAGKASAAARKQAKRDEMKRESNDRSTPVKKPLPSSLNEKPTNKDGEGDKDKDKDINNNPPPPSASDAVAEAFEAFWSAGMKKSDKKKSLAAFRRQCKGRDPHEFAAMLINDVQTRIRLGQFGFDRLMPTTYLNNNRWEDEYPQPEFSGVSSHEKRNPVDNSAAGRVRAGIERERAQQFGGAPDWPPEDTDALEFDGVDVRPPLDVGVR